jgi:hypothetical protein
MFIKKIVFFAILANISLLFNPSFALENVYVNQPDDIIASEVSSDLTKSDFLSKGMKEINSIELEQIVGLPLSMDLNYAFNIINRNEYGDVLGSALFWDSTSKKSESLLWFWDPEDGFKVIVWNSDLLLEGFEYFYFHKILFNKNGVVVAQYVQSKYSGIGAEPVDRQISWLSWSKEKGLILTHSSTEWPVLYNLNNENYVLFKKRESFDFIIVNATNPNDLFCLTKLRAKIWYALIEIWKIHPNCSKNYRDLRAFFKEFSMMCSLDDECNIKGEISLWDVFFDWHEGRKKYLRSDTFKANVDFSINMNGDCMVIVKEGLEK